MAAPDYFDLGDDGIVIMLSKSGSVRSDQVEVPDPDHDRVEKAVNSCPVSALRMENE
jgi:ferredoxin